ncbi:MAG: hypothetical protein MNSN_08220 [Minisyncoccus archaeiphilus]|uniref:DUF2341 domain-containing protein n=1 Tax=Minisyncoccus archaeiphilus TaxID=3238481 RepID=UPI002B12BB4F|nr:MAG: hypothetical protein MNSN_08220 [Candidatus Parcubacteria bacterium]
MYNRVLFLMSLFVYLLSSSVVLAADTIAGCGLANNVSTVEAPTSNLCVSGIPNFVTKYKGYYMWTCYGSNANISTDDSQCSAPVIGVCGTASTTSANPPIANLCKEGRVVNNNWLDGTYKYRKPMILANYSNVVLKDYTFNIKVTFASGMQANFNDIRFTGADGKTQLSYWIENKTDGVSANVWVRLPEIPLNGSVMYMYYGNSSVTAGSNGDDTFLLFDGFSSFDNKIWEVTNGYSPQIYGGALRFMNYPSYGAMIVASKVRIPSNTVLEMSLYQWHWGQIGVTDHARKITGVSAIYPPSYSFLGLGLTSNFDPGTGIFYHLYNGSAWVRPYISTPVYNHGWTRATIRLSQLDKVGVINIVNIHGAQSSSSGISSLDNPFIMFAFQPEGGAGNDRSSYIDWIGIRKNYGISTEPFVVFGEVQNITSSNSGPWEWYCLSGDFSTKCSSQSAGVDGKCGTAAKTYVATDTNFVGPFCESGTNIPSNIVFPGVGKTVSWKCSGTGGGKDVTCSANVDILEFDSELVTHTIPASILPEETIKNVTVTMKNTGSVTWNKAANIKLGALGDASLFGPSRLELPAGVSVATGQQHVFKFDIKAPKTSKAYNIRYKMVKD